MRTVMMSTISAAFALAGALSTGCGSEPEFPEGPPDAAPIPTPTPTPAPTPTTPTPVGCDAVQSGTFSSIFLSRAPTEVKGMEFEGGVTCGSVPEGGTVQSPTFVLQPGMCYAVLGNGLPNVTEVDLMISIDLGGAGVPPALAALAAAPLAVDSDSGAMASIGAKGNCYKWPWPIPGAVKLTVKARTGGGPIGAQIYRKKG